MGLVLPKSVEFRASTIAKGLIKSMYNWKRSVVGAIPQKL